MIKMLSKLRRTTSMFLLFLFVFGEWNTNAYGMPGGPSQPEATGFSPVNHTEMVNKFDGSFSYNIPLMDVGGYPINLAYNANVNNDMEASWVGLGWTLNTGSINRLKRGIPDDFKGDVIKREANKKNIFKIGVSKGPGAQLYNLLNASYQSGIYYKSDVGFGNDAGFQLGLSYKGLGLNFTREVHSENGVTTGLGASYSLPKSLALDNELLENLSISWGESSNSRVGLMERSWGINTSKSLIPIILHANIGYNKTTSFLNPTYLPSIDIPHTTTSGTFSGKLGGDFVGADVNATIKGYFMHQSFEDDQKSLSNKSYGYLYSDIGAEDPKALMDFNRNKDAPYFKKLPNLSVPQSTYDLFTINQHSGGGQFRAYRNGVGLVRDPYSQTKEKDFKLSLEAHFATLVEAGADFGTTNTKTQTLGKENSKSGVITPVPELKNIDYDNEVANNPIQEEYYFKKVGDLEEKDENLNTLLGDDKPVNLSLQNVFTPYKSFRGNGFENKYTGPVSKFYNIESNGSPSFVRPNKRNTNISIKNFDKKSKTSLDKQILSYKSIDLDNSQNPEYLESQVNILNPDIHKPHHIAEINVTNADGSTYNYGLPLYNIKQEEVTFTANPSKTRDNNNLVGYSAGSDDTKGNSNGLDHYFNKEVTPAYAHSWLLTSVVSPDYIDMTNDGITDDDRGTAVKLNYTKAGKYSWRNPVDMNVSSSSEPKATYNEGVEYYNNDNKGIYTYGEREEWYNHSLESKTMIAFFLTKERKDANPLSSNGKIDQSKVKKRLLDKIVLYSKAEISKILKSNPSAKMNDIFNLSVPIKTIEFDYGDADGYALCPNNPTNINNYNGGTSKTGKLTLKSLKFYSGKNKTPLVYSFEYGNNPEDNPSFNSNNFDRWGNYKEDKVDNNSFGSVTNSKFPYAVQDKAKADKNVNAWLLKKITLPSGGEIKVDYESNSYSYVQHKRTAKMYKIVGLGPDNSQNHIGENLLYSGNGSFNNYLLFETNILDTDPLTNQKVKELFFEDENNREFKDFIFYKSYVELGNGKSEAIPGYAKIEDMGLYSFPSNGKHVVWVKLANVKGYGSISVNSWQYIRDRIPHLAYTDYPDQFEFDPSKIIKIASRVLRFIFNVDVAKSLAGESKFETQAIRRRLAQKITLNGRSYVRALIPDKTKYGGGARVSKITLTDKWDKLVNPLNSSNIKTPENAEYTIDYEYTTEDKNGKLISSGVATYEPLMGGEENPWRLPVFYQGATSNKGGFLGLSPVGPATKHSLERPFGESLFPNVSIGYSKVKITTNKNKGDKTKPENLFAGNGFKVYEYYTAKDFPIRVDNTYLDANNVKRDKSDDGFSIKMVLGGTIRRWDRTAASQGYAVVLNDMHGKPKSEKLYKHGGALFSSSKYEYRSTESLPTLAPDGVIANRSYSENMDFTVDVRSMITNVSAFNVGLGGGYAGFPPFGLPWGVPAPPTIIKDEKWLKLYTTSKLVNKTHILNKTTVNKDGAIYTTENMLWDSKTLRPIVTSTNNEFNQKLYSYDLPGYYVYPKLGHAYQNQGVELELDASNFNTSTGEITNMDVYLENGDEVLLDDGTNHNLLNVLKDGSTTKLIKSDGSTFLPTTGDYNLYVYRSSFKNQLGNNVMNISSFENPIQGGSIRTNYGSIHSASAGEYKNNWSALIKTNLTRANQSPSCQSTWSVNPFKAGNQEFWKPVQSYKVLVQRKGITGVNTTPNLTQDGISKNGVKVFYTSNGTQFVKNTSASSWNSQSKNTIYDSKGSLVESYSMVSKYGLCFPENDPPSSMAPPMQQDEQIENKLTNYKIQVEEDMSKIIKSLLYSNDLRYREIKDIDEIINSQLETYENQNSSLSEEGIVADEHQNEHLVLEKVYSKVNLILKNRLGDE